KIVRVALHQLLVLLAPLGERLRKFCETALPSIVGQFGLGNEDSLRQPLAQHPLAAIGIDVRRAGRQFRQRRLHCQMVETEEGQHAAQRQERTPPQSRARSGSSVSRGFGKELWPATHGVSHRKKSMSTPI